MTARQQPINVDLFCGGGGAALGIFMATGTHPAVAVNHSAAAIAMHQANHPGTLHVRQDIWTCPPRCATQGRPVALLHASPDCRHFSKAKGAAPRRDEKIRDLPWVIVKWAREVRPNLITMENVEEIKTWGPLDQNGVPIKARAGETWKRFLQALRSEGYAVQSRDLRALVDFATPQPLPLPGEVVRKEVLGQPHEIRNRIERVRFNAEGEEGDNLLRPDLLTVARDLELAMIEIDARDVKFSSLQAQLAAKERECQECPEKRDYETHLLGCVDERERLLEIGLVDECDCGGGLWRNARAESAEAFKQRVMEWGRGRCECCEHGPRKHLNVRGHWCNYCLRKHPSKANLRDNWTPPQAWEVNNA